jgi:hypothetical protein
LELLIPITLANSDDRQEMSADAAYCYERARDCAARAREACDELIKTDFLDLEARWQLLARSYQFPEQATSVIRQLAVRKWHVQLPTESYPSSDRNDTGTFAFKSALRASSRLARDNTGIARRMRNS